MQKWLLKGYVATKVPEEDSFNAYLNKARVRVENAFGRLKGRWRILHKTIELDYTEAPKIIIACCILHNIVEDNKQIFYPSWLTQNQSEALREQPTPSFTEFTYDDNNGLTSAIDIQNALKSYLARNFPLIKSIQRTIY
jgi:hypothetical protein